MNEVKPGYLCSETYITGLTIVGLIVSLIVAQYRGDSSTIQSVIAIVASVLLAGNHTISRTALKKQAATGGTEDDAVAAAAEKPK
jgi:hypothetical protein